MAPSAVAANATYNKSSLKRAVKEYTAKDVKKHVEALFKRVEKHFDDEGDMVNSTTMKVVAGTVMEDVWKACEEHLVRDTQRYTRLIGQCYGDSGVVLEYTVADVETTFRRHRSI